MPSVSVIIPTRNRSALLPRAVESARLAGTDVEVIVIDDASTDETREVCSRLGVRCLRARRRLGPSGARNVGLVASAGEFVSFLDDDDRRLPGSLDAQAGALAARPDAGLVYGRVLYGDGEGRATGGSYPEEFPRGDIFWRLMRRNFIPCPSVVFRRECLLRVGLLDEDVPGVEDWDLWVRIAERYEALATEQAVAVWRRPTRESGQFTSRPERLHRLARRLHREKWLRLPRAVAAGEAERRAAARSFAERESQLLVWEAAEGLKAGGLKAFARVALAGARMYPVGFGAKALAFAARRARGNAPATSLGR
ncbi:MAG TPA: glycosyltransferase [Pyrinomonadaceae bacterium]|jgi:glycosyltransferase involved in cell wall biosynthesis